ncbi:GNAT family N-acetyltransferase [Actinocatenispora rupis]|uniref:GNAT family acetyltransferase n=1 Tax=Actinocatenispora rupis TaxID=519421 RepID=A0A8J3J3E9_9ACTN|nr:GNAT family N-acetyltransferase [Actinocatenispora rupis]GID09429.1 GNAT family acetyltransferase [Actinocatenispora rupis]
MTEPLTVRQAHRADVAAIVAMLADDPLGATREAPDDPAPYLAAFTAIDADPNQYLAVAEVGGELVGTLQLTYLPGLSHRGAWRAQIEAVRVARSHRGGGLGTALVRWAVDTARERGCHLVQLSSNASRTDAHRFYTRLGFTASHVGFKLTL